MSSSKFQHVSSCVQWVSVQGGCVPCVRECLSGARAKCERFSYGFMRLMLWRPSREHSERTGHGTDPCDGIGHFDPRLPSPYAQSLAGLVTFRQLGAGGRMA
eukprot:2577872-Alexandrium_andersonii.AAC.2